METDWMGEVRYFLILGTDEQASQTARRLLARFPGAKTFNLAVNGSRVTLRSISKEFVEKLTLPELLDVLRAA
jgi:hypothetical protein